VTYNSRFVYPTVFRRANNALRGLIITGIAVAIVPTRRISNDERGRLSFASWIVLLEPYSLRSNWQFLVF
jgi:hypothetical protein